MGIKGTAPGEARTHGLQIMRPTSRIRIQSKTTSLRRKKNKNIIKIIVKIIIKSAVIFSRRTGGRAVIASIGRNIG